MKQVYDKWTLDTVLVLLEVISEEFVASDKDKIVFNYALRVVRNNINLMKKGKIEF